MSHEADQAERSLREFDTLTARSRRASRSVATGIPLAGWGLAWIVGLGALDLLAGAARVVVAVLAWITGVLLSWWPMRATIRTGWEKRMRVAWVVVLVASPFMVTAAQPDSFAHGAFLLGSLWGLAMCLYAIATGDPALAVAAGLVIVVAGGSAVLDLPNSLLWFGLGAGLPLVAVGARRAVRERTRG